MVCYNGTMDNTDEKVVISKDWKKVNHIDKDDIVILESTNQEFLCSKIVKTDGYELLLLGSFDFKTAIFLIQKAVDGINYAKLLHEESEQKLAYNIFKKAINEQ